MPEPGLVWQVCKRAPEEHHKGIPAIPDSKSALLGAKPKCFYANKHSMGSKQGQLETCAHLQGWDIIGSQMWWDGYYVWNVRMEGRWLFGMDRQERLSHCAALYVNSQLERMEFLLGRDKDLIQAAPARKIEKMRPP